MAPGEHGVHPEVAELKRELTVRALEFFSRFEDSGGLDRDLRIQKAAAHYRLANVYGNEGNDEDAEHEYRQAIEQLGTLQSQADDDRVRLELAAAYDSFAQHLRLTKRTDEATEFFGKAIALLTDLAGSGELRHIEKLAQSHYSEARL